MTQNPYDMYRFLIESIRIQDRGTQFVKRWLQGHQAIFDQTLEAIGRLRDIQNYRTVDPAILDHMLWLLGFTNEFYRITGGMSDDDKRKLIGAAAAMWKQRYIEGGIENMIRFLTGRSVIIRTWFDLRWILDEDGITLEPGAFTPYLVSPTELDEFFTEIRVMDEGGLNRVMVESLLELNRPSSERFLVVYVDFMDDFTTGYSQIYQWESTAGTSEILDGKMILHEDSGVSAETIGCFDWKNYIAKWMGKSTGPIMYLVFGYDGIDDSWIIEVNYSDHMARLYHYSGGGLGPVLASGPSIAEPDTYYGFKVHNLNDGGLSLIQFYIDDNLSFEFDPATLIQGTMGMLSPVGAEAEFDIVELVQMPIETKLIGLEV